MKELISNRFSTLAKNDLGYLTQNQILFRDLVKSKIEKGFHLVANPCVCGVVDKQDKIIAEIDRYGLPLQSVLCGNCGSIRIDPYLDDKSLSDFYTDYYQEMYGRSVEVEEYFEKQKQYGKKFLAISQEFLKPTSNVLEFGCGAGGAIDVFKQQSHHVYGIEYSKKLLDFGKSKGLVNLKYGSIEDFKVTVGDLKFDLIFSNHVFEHVIGPLSYLKNCIDLLKNDGRVICSIPDIYNSHRYIFPNSDLRLMFHIAHIYNYSFEGLQAMASKLNVGIRRIYPDESIVTPTSVMPELWFELRKGSVTENSSMESKPLNGYPLYLNQTEDNFQRGINLLDVKVSAKSKIKNILKQLLKWKK